MLTSLRDATIDQLRDVDWLTDAISELGLEYPTRTPREFPDNFGGLRLWQTPIQFAPYLIALASLDIRSYAELGVHAGGSLVATVEYLDRFARVERAVAVDMELQASVLDYEYRRTSLRLTAIAARTDSAAVENALARLRPDLVLIDADHSERGCRADYELASRYARYVALHDVVEWSCRGVAAVWASIDAPKREFVDQYDDGPPIHGIGLVGPLR